MISFRMPPAVALWLEHPNTSGRVMGSSPILSSVFPRFHVMQKLIMLGPVPQKGKLVRDEKENSDWLIRTAKKERSRSSVYNLYKLFPFSVSIFSDLKSTMREVFFFNLVIWEFQCEFYFPEPLTKAGEEARLEE